MPLLRAFRSGGMAMLQSEMVDAVARVAVDVGIRARKDDLVVIDGTVIHRDLMLAMARECWKRGARYVYLRYGDDLAFRDRVSQMPLEWIDGTPGAIDSLWSSFAKEGWLRLAIYGDEDPAFLEDVEPERLKRASAASHRALQPAMEAAFSFTIPWNMVTCPTDAWARLVFGRPDAKGADLWPLLLDAMRIDAQGSEGPLAHYDSLAERARKLNGLAFDTLRFTAPGTDLAVGLSTRSRWMGGTITTPDGRRFVPNIPTEEVFTTPDFRRTEGRVRCSRPVMILDVPVEGAWLEFRKGEVVASGASKGAGILERFLAMEKGSRRLGEVALVDCSSPVWRSGRFFRNILLDENAGCHIALGSGIPKSFEGADAMDKEEREAAGFNDSFEHDDLTFGSDELDVDAMDATGRSYPLMRSGHFTEP
jgi:aminopeptidase